MRWCNGILYFFFFNDTATTEIYTLSLHDALPIWILNSSETVPTSRAQWWKPGWPSRGISCGVSAGRSEEHTSELQSRSDLVCRLLLEKKTNPRQPPLPDQQVDPALRVRPHISRHR